MADQLSVVLTADVANFNSSIGSAAANIQKVEQDFRSSISVINGNLRLFGESAENTSQRINAIQTAINGLLRNGIRPADERIQNLTRTLSNLNGSNGLVSMTRQSNQAGMALMNMGRIAQDSSFGFIGIANNLNPLLESFQRLRAESGSNAGALRALGSSLMGAGGVGLALSAFQAVVLFSQMGLRAWTKEAKTAKDTAKEFADTLGAVEQAQLKGAIAAQKELTELKSLYSVANDTTISLKQRKDAVDELQGMYPEYFKNLKDETILNGGAKAAYDNLTTSIIATAKARAAQDLITKKASSLLVNEAEIKNSEAAQLQNKKSESFRVSVNKKAIADAKKLDDIRAGGIQISGAEANLAAINSKYSEAQARHEEYTNKRKRENAILTKEILDLEKLTTDQVKKGADLAGKVGAIRKEPKAKKVKPVVGNLGTPDDFGILGIVPSEITAKPILKIVPVLDLKSVDQAYIDLSTKIDEIGDKITSMTSISGAVETLGESFSVGFSAIGEALASGGNVIEAFGSAFLSSFAAFLSELGAMVIKKGALLIAIGVAENLVIPGSGAKSIASGATLLAAGAALSIVGGIGGAIGKGGSKGQSSSSNTSSETPRRIPQFATGIQNFKGGMALVGERGPELVDLPTGASVIPTGRTERMMNTSNKGVVVSTELGIEMGVLVARIRQEQNKQDRLG